MTKTPDGKYIFGTQEQLNAHAPAHNATLTVDVNEACAAIGTVDLGSRGPGIYCNHCDVVLFLAPGDVVAPPPSTPTQ